MSFSFKFDEKKFARDLKKAGEDLIKDEMRRKADIASSVTCKEHNKPPTVKVKGKELEMTFCFEALRTRVMKRLER